MSNITLGQIVACIIAIAGFIGAVKTISDTIKKSIEKGLDKIQAPLNDKINKMDIMQCRIFLVNHLEEKKRGIEKSEYEELLAHEVYKHYTEDLKSNSYIHRMWNDIYNK